MISEGNPARLSTSDPARSRLKPLGLVDIGTLDETSTKKGDTAMESEDFLPDLNKTAEKYREKVQKLIKYCVTCQPYDGGSYVWIMGDKTTIDEIFDSVDCPERYRDDIAKHLGCPNCGNSSFERYDTVGTEDGYILRAERHYYKSLNLYNKRISNFKEHLEKYPSLAVSHSLGRKILKEITEMKVDSDSIKNDENSWFRARGVDQSRVFDSNDLYAPPLGKSSGGRFHHPGQSVLYLADSKDLAMTEALENPSIPSIIWVQEYKLSREIDNLLDLRYDWDNYGQLSNLTMAALLASGCIFEAVEDRNNKWKPQYFITTFIADCARLAGYKGILYSSSRGNGYNVVIFNNQDYVVPEGKPKVFIYEGRGNLNIFEDGDHGELPF